MKFDPSMDRFLETRDTRDLPQDHLLDWATTCSDEGMRLHAKTVLIRKAVRDAILENTVEAGR